MMIIKPQIRQLPPYQAGLSLEQARAFCPGSPIAKLASNENPLGASPAALAAAGEALAEMAIYPDSQGNALRRALAATYRTDAQAIVLGAGSEEIISLICRAVLQPGDRVVTPYPSFPLHETFSLEQGASVLRLQVNASGTPDPEAFGAATAARIVFLSNPLNPTGAIVRTRQFKRMLANASSQQLWVIDQAYGEYVLDDDYPDPAATLSLTSAPWIILRTFSKAYGLAGLRLGYAVCSSPELAQALDRVRPPFSANRIAQGAALAALKDERHLSATVELNSRERARVFAGLNRAGYSAVPSEANFLFFDTRVSSTAFAQRLLSAGVVIKPWLQSGFDSWARVSIGSPESNDRFLSALVALQ